MTPTGGIRDPMKANAAFERALKGRCFCPLGKNYALQFHINTLVESRGLLNP